MIGGFILEIYGYSAALTLRGTHNFLLKMAL